MYLFVEKSILIMLFFEFLSFVLIKILNLMEIASSWKLHSEGKINTSEFSSNQCLFSPDGKTFCQCAPSSISLITNEKTRSIIPPTQSSEEIKCIATVFSSPWILSIGTSIGKVLFYDFSTEKYLTISPDNRPVQFIKSCSFTESNFTKPYPILLIQYPKGVCATINLDNLLQNIKNNTPDNIVITKWQLSNDKNIRDSIVINSNISSPFHYNLFQFPAVYSVGKPFITVSSISSPQTSTKGIILKKASQVLKWMFMSDNNNDEKEEIEVSGTSNEWELDDDKREGISMAADPTGRWIVICDNMFRVMIIDAIFGRITKMLKGYRDAQVAWFSPKNSNQTENPYLVIYVPTREIIVVCTIPNGNTVAAVRVARDGKLFQTIDADSHYGVTFVYPSGDVAILNISIATKEDESEQSNAFDSNQFNFPSIVTAEKDQSLIELQKTLFTKKWEYQEVKQLASNVSDKIAGGLFIKMLVCTLNGTDEDDTFLIEVINSISEKFKIEGLEQHHCSREFFENSNTSVQVGGDDDLAIYKTLTTKWLEYSKFEKIMVSEEKYPQTNLTSKYKDKINNVINCVSSDSNIENDEEFLKRPSLKSFLLNPMESPLFFFSFMRNENVSVESIFDMYRISREEKNNFILLFLIWIVTCQPAQILLTQEAISDFLRSKTIKSIAQKQYKKLDLSSNSVNISALYDFLSF